MDSKLKIITGHGEQAGQHPCLDTTGTSGTSSNCRQTLPRKIDGNGIANTSRNSHISLHISAYRQVRSRRLAWMYILASHCNRGCLEVAFFTTRGERWWCDLISLRTGCESFWSKPYWNTYCVKQTQTVSWTASSRPENNIPGHTSKLTAAEASKMKTLKYSMFICFLFSSYSFRQRGATNDRQHVDITGSISSTMVPILALHSSTSTYRNSCRRRARKLARPHRHRRVDRHGDGPPTERPPLLLPKSCDELRWGFLMP